MVDGVTIDAAPADAVVARLSLLDRFLPVWIGLAMLVGIGLGKVFTGLDDTLDKVKIDTVSLPIAIGLLAMMYPVLAKVKYRSIGSVVDRRSLVMSLVLNWLIGPLLMFTLAWLLLPDLPEYRTGLIIVGLARCIAMVLIWNDLACGSRELAAVLVAVNSLFQIVAYSLLGYFYLELLPGWLGLDSDGIEITVWAITKSVLIFLGIPLLAGFLTRFILEPRRGTEWYEGTFLPRIGPIALYGLLFTIVVLFALQGDAITENPWDVGAYRDPTRGVLRDHVDRFVRGRVADGVPVRPQRVDRVHRCGQQLRARDRGGHRRVRGLLGAGARRRRRTAHRGPGSGRAGLRLAVGSPPLLPGTSPPGRVVASSPWPDRACGRSGDAVDDDTPGEWT